MGFASRLFILDEDDGLHRLPGNWFAQMLREASSRPVPRFAGLRVRFAEIIVELIDRKPARIARLYWGYLRFDQNGVLDYEEFSKRELPKADRKFKISSFMMWPTSISPKRAIRCWSSAPQTVRR